MENHLCDACCFLPRLLQAIGTANGRAQRFLSPLRLIFTDLVLHYDVITDPNQGHYYLQDCYPLQFIDTDEVKANIKKNEGQWELFTYYLESKGKLRK